jgi:hypothetical protein
MGQYPSWSELIADLCKACGRAADAETARYTKDPNTLATLADIAHDNDSDAYYRVLDTVFGHRVTSTRAAYDLLMRLPFASYVTTNFDPLLEYESRKPDRNIGGIRALPSLNVAEVSRRCVFYIHGYIGEGRSAADHDLVRRQSEFSSGYSDQSTLFSFLHQLLIFHPVLFIGIGLDEPQLKRVFEICRQLRREIETQYRAIAPQRYILRPMEFSSKEIAGGRPLTQNRTKESEEDKLFEEIDVRVVRYDGRDRSHSGIEELLEGWCELSPLSIEPGF